MTVEVVQNTLWGMSLFSCSREHACCARAKNNRVHADWRGQGWNVTLVWLLGAKVAGFNFLCIIHAKAVEVSYFLQIFSDQVFIFPPWSCLIAFLIVCWGFVSRNQNRKVHFSLARPTH